MYLDLHNKMSLKLIIPSKRKVLSKTFSKHRKIFKLYSSNIKKGSISYFQYNKISSITISNVPNTDKTKCLNIKSYLIYKIIE